MSRENVTHKTICKVIGQASGIHGKIKSIKNSVNEWAKTLYGGSFSLPLLLFDNVNTYFEMCSKKY